MVCPRSAWPGLGTFSVASEHRAGLANRAVADGSAGTSRRPGVGARELAPEQIFTTVLTYGNAGVYGAGAVWR
jgi:hypothetical protein